MDIIHLLVVLAGILSPFLFLGIFFYGGHAERRAIKRDERKYGREGLKAMLDVPAGECPFCSGDVHLGLERMDGQYFHVIKRACPNGCLTVYPIAVGMRIPGPSVEEARGNAVELWNQAVRTVSNPAACGRCGARPVWWVRPGDYRLRCPECGNRGPDGIRDLAAAARLWNGGQEAQRCAKCLEDRLNAA